MQIPPPISYAERDGASIAFQQFGEGTTDMVMVSDVPSHLDLLWTDPGYVDILMRLTDTVRITMFDRRGTGLSDPLEHVPTLEEEALDVEAVMDAAGVDAAILVGYTMSTAAASYFAATRPTRVERLITVAGFARGWDADGNRWPAGDRDRARALLADALDNWGQGRLLALILPSLDSARNRRLWGTMERASASRGAARAMYERSMSLDLTGVLPSIQAPTLVLFHADNFMPRTVVAETAELIPNAVLRETGYASPPSGVADFWLPLVDEMDEFINGTRAAEHPATDRMVTTLLFTDIVGSTGLAAELGDAGWRALLTRHDQLISDAVLEEGGRVIKNIGDGSLSSFDGPVRAIRSAQRLVSQLEPLGIRIRAGVHTGECERVGLDVAGMAVHVGARVEAAAAPGQVLVTRAAAELCRGSGIEFAPQGRHELKGVPGQWELHAVAGEQSTVAVGDSGPPLRAGDRLILSAARRAPGVLRRLARRGSAA